MNPQYKPSGTALGPLPATGGAHAAAGTGAPAQAQTGKGVPLVLGMEDFLDATQIGKGKDAIVYSATCPKLGGAAVVLKVYNKEAISPLKGRAVRREARIMRFLAEAHIPHVCAYVGAFQDSRLIYIVMEHCQEGDLLEQLLKEGRAMTERRAVQEVVVPVLTALSNMHAAGVIHRDIKLENLFVSPTRGVLVGDFGLALCVREEKPISPVGTLEYMPPEILRLPTTDQILRGAVRIEDVTPIDEKVDCWSFGVTAYELVTGRSPFEGAGREEVRSNILAHNVRPLPGFLSKECIEWLVMALNPVASARPGALQLLRHAWVLRNVPASEATRILGLTVAPPIMLPPAAAAGGPKVAPPEGVAAAAAAAAAQAAAAASAQQQSQMQGVEASSGQQMDALGKLVGKGGVNGDTIVSGGIPAYVPGPDSSVSSVVSPPVGGASSGSGSTVVGPQRGGGGPSSTASVSSAPGSPLRQHFGGPALGPVAEGQQQQQAEQQHGGKGKPLGGKLLTMMCLGGMAKSGPSV